MNIYEQLGVRTVINAWGTLTRLGGSLMEPETLEAMKEAAGYFVDMDELHEKAGKRVAELLGVPAACITSGAAAGITIAAAACMTGENRANILQLPDTTGMKNEIITLSCHRTLYDQALLLTGAKVREIGIASFACVEMLEKAVTENTCMFFYASHAEALKGSLSLGEIAPVLKARSVPVVVDAAAELPPKSNISAYLEAGADLVIFSGGKEIRGPQASGVIAGREDLVRRCRLNSCPNHSVGRGMKTDKETIIGFTRAVELFMNRDYERQMALWEARVDRIVSALDGREGVCARKGTPSEPGIQPATIPRAYVSSGRRSAVELQKKLLERNPSIRAGVEKDALALNPQCLREEETDILIEALREIL